ncbi:single-stranded DNA-binding protein (plasmid) [Clostridium perfringens]|uniref:Single-stranded DNA-binding protein n=1 Tax=Clostridium perfringens E str. JGS1987 TaxID=451755 RepID=B1BWC1_CLOPF|nr:MULTISPECIES: single-stranded DNA-binding protein [Clostridium]MDU3995138.1 single-stranded DNA-binding protein [Enterobacter sp.]EDT13995.1 single-strand binding protein family [Clostridium perfringens E str. JGS1987]EHK2389497.1 single-stranded DNA-binding protein [Clostridium perfringens]EJT5928980.1 single-stranded DNA-binding protein [Clostridium perfringens]EJT6483715.1 single-stranded DNA-binding protein [Clostridium perfringens]
MNKVVLIGRLTKDPELRFTSVKGTPTARFTLAVARQFKRDETDFISCISYGKTAENIAKFLTKGRLLAISGSIRTGNYEAQDGTKRYTTEVLAESFDFIDSSKKLEKTEDWEEEYDSDPPF